MLVHKKTRLAPPEFTGRLVGYARVSTADQDVDMQIAALRRAGVSDNNIWHEQVSGVKAKRPQRDLALLDAKQGDIFVVYKLDRLGRNFRELLDIVHGLEQRGVSFRSLTDDFDTSKPSGKFMFHMLGALAEFERGLIAERTRDGMAESKAQGKRIGAPRLVTDERIEEAKRRLIAGESIGEIAASWGVTRQSLYTRFSKKKIRRLRAAWKRQQSKAVKK